MASKIKNMGAGLRGVNTKEGLRMISPGETVEVEMDEGEIKAAKMFNELLFDPPEEEPQLEFRQDMTTQTPYGASVHPMPMGSDLEEPEEVVPTTQVVAPWTEEAAQSPNTVPAEQTKPVEPSKKEAK